MQRPSSFFHLLPGLLLVSGAAGAQLQAEWIATEPAGTSLASGFADLVVEASGTSYLTGNTGAGTSTDVLTVAFDADGNRLWSRTFDGPQNGADRGRAIAQAPDGSLWVVGSTPGPTAVADVLLLHYDAATGALLDSVPYQHLPGTSESALDVAVDGAGNLFVAGTTSGDGGDVMLVSFDSAGVERWVRTWDGPAFGPFSQDVPMEVEIDPAGDVLLLITGIMGNSRPDFVVNKYDAATGATRWEASFGLVGADAPVDMVVDDTGDVYVTGTVFNLTDRMGTVKLSGADGSLLWQAEDVAGLDDNAFAITLDGQGGVYVTGDTDPDGNDSNFNENFFTVKRDAATGSLLWTHLYGDDCVGCFDRPTDVLVDPAGFVIVAGTTSSAPYSGAHISFVLDADTGLELDRGVLTTGPAGSGDLSFDAARNWYNGASATNPDTGEVFLTLIKYPTVVPTASVTTRLAAANPPSFTADSLPVLGSTLTLEVDLGLTGHTGAVIFGFTAPASATLGGGQVLLVSGARLFKLPLGSGPVAAFTGTLPDDPSLAGLQVYTQALHVLGVTPFALSNALDLTFGF